MERLRRENEQLSLELHGSQAEHDYSLATIPEVREAWSANDSAEQLAIHGVVRREISSPPPRVMSPERRQRVNRELYEVHRNAMFEPYLQTTGGAVSRPSTADIMRQTYSSTSRPSTSPGRFDFFAPEE